MDFIGVIRAENNPPGLNHQRWVALIRADPNLLPTVPLPSINPFTKATVTIHPRLDVARVAFDGRDVGMMAWSESGANEINVFGASESVVSLAREIAESLGGYFDSEDA